MSGEWLNAATILVSIVAIPITAFSAARWTYQHDKRLDSEKTKQRKATLLQTLHLQFGAIPFTMAGFEPEVCLHLDTFHATASSHLLNGNVLDAYADADLIRALGFFETSQRRYNDAIRIMKQAYISSTTSSERFLEYLEHVKQRQHDLRMWIKFVEKFLPARIEHTYAQPDPWPEEQVLPQE